MVPAVLVECLPARFLSSILGWTQRPAGRRSLNSLKTPSFAPPHTSDRNPIHAWLDRYDIPWRRSRGEMIDRYGISTQAGRPLEAVEIDVPVLPIKGLIRPLYFQVLGYFSPHLPATEFIGDAYYAPDAATNIGRTAEELSPHLGPANVQDHLNTLRVVWAFGRASVRLLAWPEDRQPTGLLPETQRQGDPRLKTRCYVTINTGFLPSATAGERAQLQSFLPICALPPSDGGRAVDGLAASQNLLEFIRDAAPFPEMGRTIGLSADRSTLIFHTSHLFMMNMASVQAISVERIRPAKGPGGSLLQVEVLTDYPGVPVKTVTLGEAAGADDLNELGAFIADAIGKPLKLSRYYSDC